MAFEDADTFSPLIRPAAERGGDRLSAAGSQQMTCAHGSAPTTAYPHSAGMVSPQLPRDHPARALRLPHGGPGRRHGTRAGGGRQRRRGWPRSAHCSAACHCSAVFDDPSVVSWWRSRGCGVSDGSGAARGRTDAAWVCQPSHVGRPPADGRDAEATWGCAEPGNDAASRPLRRAHGAVAVDTGDRPVRRLGPSTPAMCRSRGPRGDDATGAYEGRGTRTTTGRPTRPRKETLDDGYLADVTRFTLATGLVKTPELSLVV